MTRILLVLFLMLSAASAGATTWPWEEPTPDEPPQYCKGLVVGGLASKATSGMSRTELWLAWNYVIRSSNMDQTVAVNEYQEGLQKFQNVADATAAASILQQADGECGLGRSGHEVTGW